MSVKKFILTYRSGKQEEIVTDAEGCEQQCMRSFGLTLEEAREFGANVELSDEVKKEPEHELLLLGSSVQPAMVKVGGVEATLGEVVRVAFEKSGLAKAEWNALDESAREAYIAAEVDVLEEGGEQAAEEDGVELSAKGAESTDPAPAPEEGAEAPAEEPTARTAKKATRKN